VRSFAESYFSDTDNIVPFENTTPINLTNLLRVLYFDLSILINRSGIFKRFTMLSMSDKYNSVNKRTQEISESMKLHIGVWQNAHEILLGIWLIG